MPIETIIRFPWLFLIWNHFQTTVRKESSLSRILIKEKRKIDELGWYKKHSVGVILPYTSSHGARKFSVRLSRTLNFIMPDSFCYLFTYPLEEKLMMMKIRLIPSRNT